MPMPTVDQLPEAADKGLVPSASTGAALALLDDRLNEFVLASKSPNTIGAYRADWRQFLAWCDEHEFASLPASPETIARYVTDLAGVLAVATIGRRVTSISQAHKAAGVESPTSTALVRETMRGIRRTFGVAPDRKSPLRSADIRRLVGTLDLDTLIGVRDRALLVVGFAGAFRRGELVALDVEDVEWTPDGLKVRIRRSKTDQEGEGAVIGLPYGSDPSTCPVRTLRAWLDAAGITEGAVFRSCDRWGNLGGRLPNRAVASRVQKACADVGLDPARHGGHSLRAGLITSAMEGGAQEWRTMEHSRHRSVHVFRSYVRDLNLLDGSNPVAVVGL